MDNCQISISRLIRHVTSVLVATVGLHVSQIRGAEALPDLIPIADAAKSYVYGWRLDQTTQPGRVLLRLTTVMGNKGQGPLEVWGGSISGSSQQVYQRIYNTDNSTRDRLTGSFIYHPSHNHLHLEGFATYNLRRMASGNTVGDIIAAGRKTSFCLVNIDNYWPSVSSAALILHGRGGTMCGPIQGVSTGYADLYGFSLPDQWIDVTDVPSGTYWIEVVADPDNRILELDETNNIVRIQIGFTNPVAPPANRAPVVANPGTQASLRSQSITLQMSASDPDGDSLVYTATGLPAGLGLDANTGRITGIVAASAAASYTTTVIASDGRLQGSTSFTWRTEAPLTGTGLRGEYYSSDDLTSLQFTRTDATVDFNVAAGSPDPRLASDHFSIRWKGKVIPPISGTCTFIVRSDDGARLWINGQRIINQFNAGGPVDRMGSATVSAGQEVDIVLEYFEGTGNAECHLRWEGTGLTRQVIPTNRLIPAIGNEAPLIFNPGNQTGVVGTLADLSINATDPNGTPLTYSATGLPNGLAINATSGRITGTFSTGGNASSTVTVSDGSLTSSTTFAWAVSADPLGTGLHGAYFNDLTLSNHIVEREDALVDFNWGTGSPAPGINSDGFSVRWSGDVLPEFTEDYTLKVVCDTGCRLWVNDMLQIWAWEPAVGATLPATYTATLRLQARQRAPIRLEFNETTGNASIRLTWASPSRPEQVIPTTRLFPIDYHPPVDPVAPTVTLSSPGGTVTGTFPVNIEFSEWVTGLQASDFVVTNGAATGLSGSGPAYVLTVTPAAAGTVSLSLPSNRVGDASGNGNIASNTLAVTYSPGPVAQPGLKAEYFANNNLSGAPVLTRIDSSVSWYWPDTASPGAGIPGDGFSVRWTGKIVPPRSETYSFFADVDDGMRLYVNGQLLLDKWNPVPNTYFDVPATPIALLVGQAYDLRIDYQDFFSDAYIVLKWQTPTRSREVIAADRYLQPSSGPDTTPPGVTLSTTSASVAGSFTVSAAFTEAVTGLVAGDFAVSNGAAGVLTGSGSAYSLAVTPTAAGSVTVSLPVGRCTDAAGNGNTVSNTLSVNYTPVANHPPSVTTPGNQSTVRGTAVNLRINASDPDGNPITFTASGLPSGLSIGTDGLITGTVSQDAAASNSVTVSASDGTLAGSATFIWTTSATGSLVPGLNGEYFANNSLTGTPALTRTDSSMFWYWPGSSSPGPGVPGDNFSVRWTGKIVPPTSGTYTFIADVDDGMKLYVNGQLLLDKWNPTPNTYFDVPSAPIALTAGQAYDLTIEYQDFTSDAYFVLKWQTPTRPREAIGADRYFRTGTGEPPRANGLTANYFNGTNFQTSVLERIDAGVNFSWSGSPGTGVNADQFSVRWTGCVVPQFSETYTFYTKTNSGEGVRFWIDEQLKIDTWANPTSSEQSTTLALTANRPVMIKLEYYEATGSARAELRWSSRSVSKQIIPQSRLLLNEASGLANPAEPGNDFAMSASLRSGLENLPAVRASLHVEVDADGFKNLVYQCPEGLENLFRIEVSDDLKAWFEAVPPSQIITESADGWQTVRIPRVCCLRHDHAFPGQFFRLRVRE